MKALTHPTSLFTKLLSSQHMFFGRERVKNVRFMKWAKSTAAKSASISSRNAVRHKGRRTCMV